jgi:hypothetical protein
MRIAQAISGSGRCWSGRNFSHAKEGTLSSISAIAGGAYAASHLTTPSRSAAPAATPAPAAADPDHDGDTDKAGTVDVKA